jgi:hypothetical protein
MTKVTVEFGEELTPAIQAHLSGELKSVQCLVRAAVVYFNKMLKAEKDGQKCGHGDNTRFAMYNTVVSPTDILEKIEEEYL